MKLLLDQGTPRSAGTILRQAGFDAVHTGEIGLAEAEDSETRNLTADGADKRGWQKSAGNDRGR